MFFSKLNFKILLLILILNQCSIRDASSSVDPAQNEFLSLSVLSSILTEFPYEVNPAPGVLSKVPKTIVLKSINAARDISKSSVEITLNEVKFSNFEFRVLDGQNLQVEFLSEDWQGLLKLNFLIQGEGNTRAPYLLSLNYTIDSSSPVVSVLNKVGEYPKFISDKYMEVNFNEKVFGAENPNNFSFGGSASGTLVAIKSVRISDTSYRLSLLGAVNPSFSSLSLTVSNIKDTNNNFLQSTLNFKIPIVREVGDMASPRTFSQCIQINSQELYVIGGWQNGTPVTAIERINLADYSSQVVGNLATPRVFFSASRTNDGRIFVSGGLRGSDILANRLNTAEWIQTNPFSVSTASFTLPAVRYLHESIPTDDGNLLVFGGQSAAATKLTQTSVINPNTNTISVGPTLGNGREGFGWVNFQSKLWIAGGEISNNLPTDSVESIRLTSPYAVTSEGKLSVARSLLRLVQTDGRLMAIGGRNSISVPELWNGVIAKFEPLSINDNGTHYASSMVWDQNVILDIGGYFTSPVESQAKADVRLIDPKEKVTVSINSLKNARYGHCAVAIGKNKILIIGGSQGNTSSSNSRDTPAMEVIEYND